MLLLLTSGCGGLFYYPDHEAYFLPEKAGFERQDLYFSSGDGENLHAWFFRAKPLAKNTAPKGTVVQFHGNAENLTSHFASLVWLTKEGYNLFIFDYRGYGVSTGKPSSEGLYKDGMSALDLAWTLHRGSNAKKFIVYGQSIGGIVAGRSFADFQHRNETSLIVFDSTFSSFKDLVQEKLAHIWLTWPFSPLGRLSVSDRYASKAALPSIQTPALVIIDERDPVVSAQNGIQIHALLGSSKKELWRFNAGRHVGIFASDTPENRKRFLSFVDGIP